MILNLMDVNIAMITIKYEDIRVNINKDVINNIIKFKQTKGNFEAGGILIGSIFKDGGTIDINDYTAPLASDKRTRFWFGRSEQHNKILYDKWEKSSYTKLYLGEWHTHPQNYSTPSAVDIFAWNKLLAKSKTESEIIIFIIVGLNSLNIWIGDKKLKKVIKSTYYEL